MSDRYHVQKSLLKKTLWFFFKVFLVLIIPAICIGFVLGWSFK